MKALLVFAMIRDLIIILSHARRISNYYTVIIDCIYYLDKNAKAHNEVTQRLDKLERWRWFVVGVASVIGFLLAQATNLANIF